MILYIGPCDDTFNADTFVPFYFMDDYEAIKWPPEAYYSRKEFFESIKKIVSFDTKFSGIIIDIGQDPIFYENELLELRDLVTLVGVFNDDTFTPQYSLELAFYFDFVLVGDPSQVLRYETIGVPSALHLYNINIKNYKVEETDRDIDLFFFGSNEKGRGGSIDYIKNNLSHIKIVDITSVDSRLPFKDLVNYLNRSKITVNWSGVRTDALPNNFRDPLVPHYKQFKARLLESGLMGCVCFTDFQFKNTNIFSLEFESLDDLISQIDSLLLDDKKFDLLSSRTISTATEYVNSIQKPMRIQQIRRRRVVPLSNSMIDGICSTYSLIHALNNLSQFRFKLFIRDLLKIRFLKLCYRYLLAPK